MSNEIGLRLLVAIARTIDIPDSAYETAEKRYEDLGGWFARPEAEFSLFDPPRSCTRLISLRHRYPPHLRR